MAHVATANRATASLDRSSPVPLYYQVARELEEGIESGRLVPGARLDPDVALALRLGVSRPTVRRAIEYLVDRGLVVRKRGMGTHIAHPTLRRSVELSSLYDDLAAGGAQPTTQVLSFATVPVRDAVTTALGLAPGSPVLSIERLRFTRGEPLALLRNFLPVGVVDLSADDLERHGLYQLMRGAGVRLHTAAQVIGAVTARRPDADLLAEPRGAPLLTMRRTTHDDTGRAVEYASHVYRASNYSFEFTVSAR